AGKITVHEAFETDPNPVTPIAIAGVNSSFEFTAGGDITVIGGIWLGNSGLMFDAEGDILFDNMGSVYSTAAMGAGGDILFDSIIAKGSDITLAAQGSIARNNGIECGEYGNRAFIKYAEEDTDATAGLSLSAGNAIASEDSRLIVDIPAAVTLNMPHVGDFHIDALRLILADYDGEGNPVEILVGETPILAVEMVGHPDNPKINEFLGRDTVDHETELDGDHLKWIEDQFLQAALDAQSVEELAAWIMLRAERGEWTQALEQAVVQSLLGAADEETGLPVAWVAQLVGDARLVGLLSPESVAALAASGQGLSASALGGITTAAELTGRLTQDDLDAIFATLNDEQKALAGLDEAATGITAAELAILLGLSGSGLTLASMLPYMTEEFLARLALRASEAAAVQSAQEALDADAGAVYGAIFGPAGSVSETEDTTEPDAREQAPTGKAYTLAYEDAAALLAQLLRLQLTKVLRLDAEGDPVEDENGDPIWDDGPQCLPALGEYLGSLLTAADIEILYKKALDASVYPAEEAENGLEDPAPRAITVHIGESTGTAYLYNDGSITILQDTGDLTVGEITSERGSVSITATDGSILAHYDGGVHDGHHILGRDITLAATGDVGTQAAPLKLEQRENSPLIVVGVDEEMYWDPDYIAKLLEGLTEFDSSSEMKYILRQ
ncbi:MAG: hypothetical protein GX597_04435, partial [Anaerolineaceae bacterium]|nr:hypothetical protein [Anaerolineaceae bacterium]